MAYIYADNYRGFTNQIIPIKRVNFMVGENSTGKSSILDLLDVFGNRNFWILDPDFVTSNGTRSFFDLVSVASSKRSRFTIAAWDFDKNGSEIYGIIVTYKNKDGLPEICRATYLRGNLIFTIDCDKRSNDASYINCKTSEIFTKNEDVRKKFDEVLRRHSSQAGFISTPIPDGFQDAPLQILATSILHFDKKTKLNTVSAEKNPGVLRIPRPFSQQYVNMAPIRAMPRRTYDDSIRNFESNGGHTPFVIRKMLSSEGNFKKYIDEFGRGSGLYNALEIKSYGKSTNSPFELRINLGAKGLDLGNVGLGVSQSLPLIVEIFSRDENTCFAIQQPEVHLHPRAQAKFGSIIFTIAKNEKKSFFIETHSDFTIDRFRIEIRKNNHYIDSQILFFSKSKGFNSIDFIEVEKDGSLSEKQPDAYREFFINESIDLLG